MQRSQAFGRRSLGAILATSIVLAPALSGCDSGGGPPAEQARAGQEAAKSSMDYMRKRIGERKGASPARTTTGRR